LLGFIPVIFMDGIYSWGIQVHAKFICGNNEEDGILEVIDYIRHHNAGVQAG